MSKKNVTELQGGFLCGETNGHRDETHSICCTLFERLLWRTAPPRQRVPTNVRIGPFATVAYYRTYRFSVLQQRSGWSPKLQMLHDVQMTALFGGQKRSPRRR